MKKFMFFVAIAAMLVSCGGGSGRPQFGDNEFPVKTVGTKLPWVVDGQNLYLGTKKIKSHGKALPAAQ